jgi:hypothetical protein
VRADTPNPAAIGITLLIGIIKKNGIMLVDCHLGGALPPVDTIREACLLRFRPIMMTTAARRRAASAMCSKPLRASACVATQQTTTGHQTRQASTGPTSKETGRRPARGWACISNLGRFRFLPQNREGALFAISLT